MRCFTLHGRLGSEMQWQFLIWLITVSDIRNIIQHTLLCKNIGICQVNCVVLHHHSLIACMWAHLTSKQLEYILYVMWKPKILWKKSNARAMQYQSLALIIFKYWTCACLIIFTKYSGTFTLNATGLKYHMHLFTECYSITYSALHIYMFQSSPLVIDTMRTRNAKASNGNCPSYHAFEFELYLSLVWIVRYDIQLNWKLTVMSVAIHSLRWRKQRMLAHYLSAFWTEKCWHIQIQGPFCGSNSPMNIAQIIRIDIIL